MDLVTQTVPVWIIAPVLCVTILACYVSWRAGCMKGFAEGKKDGVLVGVQNERKRRAASPYAQDWPERGGAIQVVTVPCEAVTLRADYIASKEQLYRDPVLKDEVLAEMSKVLHTQAMDFIDVQIEDDPLLAGVRFAGRPIVVRKITDETDGKE